MRAITLGFALGITLAASRWEWCAAQNVSAHYAKGQLWVVWNVEEAVLTNCIPG